MKNGDFTRILHEGFYCDRRRHGVFGSFFEIQPRMHLNTIRPRISKRQLCPPGANLPSLHRFRHEVSCNMRVARDNGPEAGAAKAMILYFALRFRVLCVKVTLSMSDKY